VTRLSTEIQISGTNIIFQPSFNEMAYHIQEFWQKLLHQIFTIPTFSAHAALIQYASSMNFHEHPISFSTIVNGDAVYQKFYLEIEARLSHTFSLSEAAVQCYYVILESYNSSL
jgi:hypothetical protein